MQKTDLKHSKIGDLVSEYYHEWGSEIDAFLGNWVNVNVKTGQIARLELTFKDDNMWLHGFGKLEEGEMDWGQSLCNTFSSNVGSPEIEGFVCDFEFEFVTIHIAGNMKYGVMVIQSYNTFIDGSDRNNYFCREFFVRKTN